MSTKTLRKRIALVAVAALGAGLLSVTPANATTTDTLTVSSSTAGAFGNCSKVTDDSAALATVTSATTGLSFTAPVGNNITVTAATNSDWVKIVGPASIVPSATQDTYFGSTGRYVDTSGDADVTINLTGVGTVTLYNLGDAPTNLATAEAAVPGTGNRVTITVVASCTVDTMSASKSAIIVTDAADADDTLVAGTYGPDTLVFPAGEDAYAHIQAFNTYATALPAGTWVASATNNAKVAIFTSAAAATAVTAAGTLPVVAKTATTGADVFVRVSRADDTKAQSTTVTLTYNGINMLTRTITFLGEATAIKVVANLTGSTVDGVGMFWYSLVDAAGNAVPGSIDVDPTTFGTRVTQIGVGGAGKDATISAESITGFAALGKITYGAAVFDCKSSAGTGSATLTIRHYQPVTGAYITLPVTVKCAGGVDTYSISTDKASYKVGDIATVTITAKDATGAAVSDFASVGIDNAVVAGGMSKVDNQLAADTFLGGVKTYKFQVTGSVTGTGGAFNASSSIAGSTTKSATAAYTITSGESSLADVLKAIVSLIASINKQIAALQKALLKKK